MFNFPTNMRPPGFRVGPSGEPETDEATPGFAVPEGGYGPSGFNVNPQGLVPVNCTSSGGSTNCMTPGGQSFIEPRPPGFPARGKSTIHVEGESTAELQSVRSPARARRMFSDDTWRAYVDTIRRRMK